MLDPDPTRSARAPLVPLALRIALFTVCVPGTVIGLIPWLMVRAKLATGLAWPVGVGWLGLVATIAGAAIYLVCAWEFGARGRGTPAPFDPPRRLVVTGLYRRVRNPMYVGVVLALLGESVLWQDRALAIYACALWAAFHLWVLLYEEPKLRRLFGPDFDAYRATVPRWLPRPAPRRASP